MTQKKYHPDFDVWWSREVASNVSLADWDVKKMCVLKQGVLMLMCLRAYTQGRDDGEFSKGQILKYETEGEQKDD